MDSTLSKESDGIVPLPATQDIRTCVDLARRLAAELKPGRVVVVDAGAFQAGDVTLVQTLVAARRTAELMEARIEITHAPPALAALLERCGLDDEARASLIPGT
jgi:hypothetical protein